MCLLKNFDKLELTIGKDFCKSNTEKDLTLCYSTYTLKYKPVYRLVNSSFNLIGKWEKYDHL